MKRVHRVLRPLGALAGVTGARAASSDAARNAAELVRLAKDGRAVTIASAGMLAHDEQPDAVEREIVAFADAIYGSASASWTPGFEGSHAGGTNRERHGDRSRPEHLQEL